MKLEMMQLPTMSLCWTTCNLISDCFVCVCVQGDLMEMEKRRLPTTHLMLENL